MSLPDIIVIAAVSPSPSDSPVQRHIQRVMTRSRIAESTAANATRITSRSCQARKDRAPVPIQMSALRKLRVASCGSMSFVNAAGADWLNANASP